MPVSDYTVEDPLRKVQQLFEANPELTHEHVKKVYTGFFSNPENYKKIYTLNRKSLSFLQSGRLIHMRCMVQDMYNPEYFVPHFQITNKITNSSHLRTALYSDHLSQSSEEVISYGEADHRERNVFYCVPVPAETAWFKSVENKRFCEVCDIACQSDKASTKRKMDEEKDGGGEKGDDNDVEMEGVEKADKRLKTSEQKEKHDVRPYQHNFPLPNEGDLPAILKVYDTDMNIQLNDVIEVVGVLSLQSVHAHCCDDGMMEDEEWSACNPHPLIVPRIHAILISKQAPLKLFSSPSVAAGPRMAACRERLLSLLTSLLLGDNSAALCLLCHILSCVYVRHDVTPLGKLSLNLQISPPQTPSIISPQTIGTTPQTLPTTTPPTLPTTTPPTIPPPSQHTIHLHNFLQKLVTKCHLFDMTLDNMNSSRLVPSKDYTDNRLKSGLLQLSKGTHLVIDETKLLPGKLDSNGIRNLAALSEALQWQRINYDFQFHTAPFNTDIRFLIISQGKSLLKTDLSVKVEASPAPSPSSTWLQQFLLLESLMSEEWWAEVRHYVIQAQEIPFAIQEDVQKYLEEEFVQGRRQDKMTTEQMHTLLTIARYICMSEGSAFLRAEHWHTAKKLLLNLQNRTDKQ